MWPPKKPTPESLVSPPPCQDRGLHGRPVLVGVASGEGHGRRIACRHGRPAARNAGRVERRAAPVQAVVGPHPLGPRLAPPVTALRGGLSERAATRHAVAHRGVHPLLTPQIAGCVGTTRRGHGPGPVGTPTALEAHPRDGFARRERCWGIRPATSVDPVPQPSSVDHRRHDASGVQALDADRGHAGLLPRILWRSGGMQQRINGFVLVSTGSMSDLHI
jgi:hypothetical protein